MKSGNLEETAPGSSVAKRNDSRVTRHLKTVREALLSGSPPGLPAWRKPGAKLRNLPQNLLSILSTREFNGSCFARLDALGQMLRRLMGRFGGPAHVHLGSVAGSRVKFQNRSRGVVCLTKGSLALT
jgi:hypothetical protein